MSKYYKVGKMKKAFTLIELIFVIVIIGLLAAVAVPRFMTVEQNAKFKPALIVSKEIARKWVEQYNQIQDANLSRVVLKDPHIQKYLKELTSNVDVHFVWDVRDKSNSATFAIGYKLNKTLTGNVHQGDNEPDGTPIETDDSSIGWFSSVASTSPRKVKWTKTCIKVNVQIIQVPVSIDHNVTQFDANVSYINPKCIRTSN